MVRWICLGVLAATTITPPAAHAQAEPGWTDLLADRALENWQAPRGQWQRVTTVGVREDNPRLLAGAGPTGPILYNGPTGRTPNLVTRDAYGDIALHAEFFVPHRSNSGIKFEGLYEVQIADSWDAKTLSASECGGVYPRAELLPSYHHIDDGYPPLTNACLPPGRWQTLDVVFRAPHFDAQGRKETNARFESVVLNGQTIHANLEMPFPTGHAWRRPEPAEGPILLQGDHGPVAFRNLRIRRLEPPKPAAPKPSELNRQFVDPKLDPAAFVTRFETETREIFAHRSEIAALVAARPGESIADVGAGTGLFSRIFADQVGAGGVVYAVDIARPMLRHIADEAKKGNQTQIQTVASRPDSVLMPDASLDAVFLCDTYHHFEDPRPVLASIQRALRPGGRLILVEFDRRPESSPFILQHIRADQATFVREIEAAGFHSEPVSTRPDLHDNFVATFRKNPASRPEQPAEAK